jgi:ATP-dependent Lhr-like helicase
MSEVLLGASPASVTFTSRATSVLGGLRATYADNVAPEHVIVRLPSDSTGRWWTWAGHLGEPNVSSVIADNH